MLHELQTGRECPLDTTGKTVGAPERFSPAIAADRRRETDLIMEELLREYLNSSPPKAEP
jgi:hypothetical protein